MRSWSFEVEHAGCDSCAERVRAALAPLAAVDGLAIDAEADLARVRVLATDLSPGDVDAALEAASAGSGHAYRIKPGSWNAA